MDWLSLIGGLLAGAVVTGGVFRAVVLPRLREMTVETEFAWDDDILDAVDTAIDAAERYLGAAASRDALEAARREALETLGVDAGENEQGDER